MALVAAVAALLAVVRCSRLAKPEKNIGGISGKLLAWAGGAN
jgi:hypothetical protein